MNRDVRALPLSPALLESVAKLGFETLTPIQAESIPVLLEGRDVIAQSRTGSGKTTAFGLPLLQRIALSPRALQALVLCPTRELCAQVARVLRQLGSAMPGLHVLTVSGGEPLRAQAQALERGVHVVVGTPGRVVDHLGRGTLDFASVRMVVLDEADRMLEMGFQEAMEQVLEALPGQRQTALFSATFPKSIELISRDFQRAPVRIDAGSDEGTTEHVRQALLSVEREQKLKALRWLLGSHAHESAMVFCNQKASVAEVCEALARAGLSVDALHGDLEQVDRDRAMAKFRNRSTRVLVATDVAARGIDVSTLELVVNYDLPLQPEVYVHRIGRTGRAGKEGLAVSLMTPRETEKVRSIEKHTGTKLERLEMDAHAEVASAPVREAAMCTLRISGGRRQKVRPGDILGALTGEAGGLAAAEVGKIEIHDNFSFVAVSKDALERAQKGLSFGRIKGRKFVVSRVH